MKHEGAKKIVYLFVIAGRRQKEPILVQLAKAGLQLTNVIYGHGTVKAGYLQSVLGLVPEEHKVLLCCPLLEEKADEIMGMLVEKFHFDRPNTGIAFTIPIEKVSY